MPPQTPQATILRAQSAFLIAALSGDKNAAGKAIDALKECSNLCKQAESPETWTGWVTSWVVAPEPQEATAVRALSDLMLAMAYGMNNDYLNAPLTLRRSLALFNSLPCDVSAGLTAVRNFGVGMFSILLALLPRPVSRLLTLTGGVSETSLFGAGGASEALGEELLQRAGAFATTISDEEISSALGGGSSGGYDYGAGWLALIVLLLHRSSKLKPEDDAGLPSSSGTARRAGLAIDVDLTALEKALPGSLVFEWLSAMTLRRIGRIKQAAETMDAVASKAAALRLDAPFPLYRVTFNRAQVALVMQRATPRAAPTHWHHCMHMHMHMPLLLTRYLL